MNTLDWLRHANAIAGRVSPALTASFARRLLLRPQARPPRRWERPAADSAQRVTFRFGLSGLRWGSQGPVVLMLHGWEGRPTQFGQFVAPLLAAGRQVIALEAPAHGASPGEQATLVDFAMALQEAAVEIRELEAVVGHSMGAAAVALALAQGLSAPRAVLIAPPASIEQQLQRMGATIGLPPAAQRRFVALVEAAAGVAARDLEVSALARSLDVPALIVHDRDDRVAPFAEGAAIAGAWRGAELLATSGLGHWRVLSDADVVGKVTRFLAPGATARPAPVPLTARTPAPALLAWR